MKKFLVTDPKFLSSLVESIKEKKVIERTDFKKWYMHLVMLWKEAEHISHDFEVYMANALPNLWNFIRRYCEQ